MVLRPDFMWNILMAEVSNEDAVCREPLIAVIDQTHKEAEPEDKDHDGVDTGLTYPQYRQASTPVSPARWDNLNNSVVYSLDSEFLFLHNLFFFIFLLFIYTVG